MVNLAVSSRGTPWRSCGVLYCPSAVLSPLVLLSRTTCCSRRLRSWTISTVRGTSFAAFRGTLSEVTAVFLLTFEGGVIFVVVEQGSSTDAASQYTSNHPAKGTREVLGITTRCRNAVFAAILARFYSEQPPDSEQKKTEYAEFETLLRSLRCFLFKATRPAEMEFRNRSP